MRQFVLALSLLVAICAPSFAQCSTLTITGSINAGQTIVADVAGAPADALVFLAVGDAGSTTFPFPGNPLVIDVAQPFFFPLGVADATGHVALSVDVPANVPAGTFQDHTFTVQAVSATFVVMPMPSLSFCVSNTALLVSGNG
jgi:hypothetical protein